MNVQLVMDFTILTKQIVANYESLVMDFYLRMCLFNRYENLRYCMMQV
jgi:hypothetical protein